VQKDRDALLEAKAELEVRCEAIERQLQVAHTDCTLYLSLLIPYAELWSQ
jgi:hypothetical protein